MSSHEQPNVGGWQSGLYSVEGVPKLAVHAFSLPLAQQSRSGSHVTVWGEVRPGSGARVYSVQLRTPRGWRSVATGRTTPSGAFARTISTQFEFVTRAWTTNPNFPAPGAGVDQLRSFESVLCGGYFFVPPLTTQCSPWSWAMPS